MLKETDELTFLGQLFSRYRLSPQLLDRETGEILKNVDPSGQPIRPHPLRCGPFAVPSYSFMARRLAAAATSTREMSGLDQFRRHITESIPSRQPYSSSLMVEHNYVDG